MKNTSIINTALTLALISWVDLNELLTRLPEGATHIGIRPVDGKRTSYYPIADIVADGENPGIVQTKESEVLPYLEKGKDRIALNWNPPAKAKKVKPLKAEDLGAKSKPAKKEVAKKSAPSGSKSAENGPTTPKPIEATKAPNAPKEKKDPVPNSGYVKAIRELLNDGKNGVSKHSIGKAAEILLAKFPDKTSKSVKRVCYNVAKTNKLKWSPTSISTGYMDRIDDLLINGEDGEAMTTRLVGEKVSVEFDKDVTSAKAVVRARHAVLVGMGKKLKVIPETKESRSLTYLG